MAIQTATKIKPETSPSPVEVMGTHAEALPVTVSRMRIVGREQWEPNEGGQ